MNALISLQNLKQKENPKCLFFLYSPIGNNNQNVGQMKGNTRFIHQTNESEKQLQHYNN